MTIALKRSWFRFSLRTVFVVVTVFACWLGYELNWLRERHFLVESGEAAVYPTNKGTRPRAPSLLWLFGEDGAGQITLSLALDKKPEPEDGSDLESLPTYNRVRRAFPEGEITGVRIASPPDGEN